MYLVYLPDVGGASKPLIQKHVGRGSSCIADDEEEDQSRNPRRRRAYDGIAGPEHLEVRHDRRVGQRPVELAPRVPRFDEVFCVVGVPAEVREVFTRRPQSVAASSGRVKDLWMRVVTRWRGLQGDHRSRGTPNASPVRPDKRESRGSKPSS